MGVFEFGMTLLRIAGAKPWSESGCFKKYASYFYMFHIHFGFVYVIGIHIAVIFLYWDDTRRMFNVLWRCCGLVTLFVQSAIVSLNGRKLTKLYTLPDGVQIYNTRVGWKVRMTDTINSVFSISQLLLVWRALVMSIAAYELTKRVADMISFLEVCGFLANTVIQMFTMCLVAQNCKEQGEGMVDVCLYKAWSGVVSSNDARVRGDRHSLLVMASRFALPLEFNAGPFYTLSLDTFTSVAGLSFSYYMFFFGLKLRSEQ